MSGNDREDAGDDALVVKAKAAARTDLVPLSSPERSAGPRPRWSPNPTFVTHLIATAERAPQTRSLRRASFADARTAYRASQSLVRSLATRTRQTI
jgi:hypothetical protein